MIWPTEAGDQPMHVTGKGIADQDRNILSNQLMILGFLRSVSGLLVRGPPPKLGSRKKKGKEQGEEDDTDTDSDQGGELSGLMGSSRGTVIITLRNVPPYTECKGFLSCPRVILTIRNPRGHLPSGEETSSSHSNWNETSQPHLYPSAFLRISQMGVERLRTPDDER